MTQTFALLTILARSRQIVNSMLLVKKQKGPLCWRVWRMCSQERAKK